MKMQKNKNSSRSPRPFEGHEFKKSLGQNFIKDTNLLRSIVRDAEVTPDDVVVEVGAGAGTLTRELANAAKSVISFEVDQSLMPELTELECQNQNTKIIFKDALKVTNDEIFDLAQASVDKKIETYKVVANIPYYITTPLIFKFLKDPRVSDITIMVQKEVAERICSTNRDSEYGGISVLVQYYGKTTIPRIVNREMFYPAPKVDSAILSIKKHKDINHAFGERLACVVRASFAARRKVVINNIAGGLGIPKQKIEKVFSEMGISTLARAEELSVAQFEQLTQKLD